MSNELARLQAWYLAHCDGGWEHDAGIRISTLDNPGWRVSIPLDGTYLEGRAFVPVGDLAPERRWMRCRVEGGRFEGAGGPVMLEEILRTFREWAGIDRRQAEVILREGGPPEDVARALVAVTLAAEERAWIEGECVRLAHYPDPNVRRVIAVCLGHLARIHGTLSLDAVEPVLRQLERDPDPSVVGAVADARDDIRQFLGRTPGRHRGTAG
ncbi:MAG: Imm53 family immunity protein [Gemmatimonadaceae bacterium]